VSIVLLLVFSGQSHLRPIPFCFGSPSTRLKEHPEDALPANCARSPFRVYEEVVAMPMVAWEFAVGKPAVCCHWCGIFGHLSLLRTFCDIHTMVGMYHRGMHVDRHCKGLNVEDIFVDSHTARDGGTPVHRFALLQTKIQSIARWQVYVETVVFGLYRSPSVVFDRLSAIRHISIQARSR
jgi:hypothetical protein